METVTFYLDMGNGKMFAANQVQVNLFKFLEKLKLKSVPSKTMYILQTSHVTVAGTYTITGHVSVNGQGFTLQQASATVSPPKPKLYVVKTKNFLQPSREDRKRWQIQSKVHSRNTSRR